VSEETLLDAVREVRGRGRRLEAYLPFASEPVLEALGRPRSRLPRAVFAAGVGGAAAAYGLQWLVDAYLYPLDAGGRPPHLPLAFLVITFEMGVLAAALLAFLGVLVVARLVRLVDDVQVVPGFESASRDRFWLEVDAPGDLERARQQLYRTGAIRVEEIGGEP
jgi:hypothetical protein